MTSNEVMVSVLMMTYNHENYITQAIESVLMQQCNFKYEIIIGEDCSTDNTRKIVLDYAKRHPKLFNLILHQRNVGAANNQLACINACKGKYIALLEGDDYWIDRNKLQKQVDFLEQNVNYSLCFHNALVIWEDKSRPPRKFCSNNLKNEFSVDDIIQKWFIPTASMVFHKECINNLPNWFVEVYNGDYCIQLLCAMYGKVHYMQNIMSVYRRNRASLSGSYSEKVNLKRLEFLFNNFNSFTSYAFDDKISNRIKNIKRRRKYMIFYQLHSNKYTKKLYRIFLRIKYSDFSYLKTIFPTKDFLA